MEDASSTGGLDATSKDGERLERAARVARQIRRRIVGAGEETQPGEIPGLAGRLIENAGCFPGKYNRSVALSTHLINATVVGTNAYVYERIVRDQEQVSEEEVRLLIAALALHDVNKYIDAAYDVPFDTQNNTSEVLDYYFEAGDDFGIRRVLPGDTEAELARDIADVKWLVQRTETQDQTSGTRGKSTQRARSLERYCRIGDGFVSKVGADDLIAGTDWLSKFFSETEGSDHVQHLEFTRLEQPILNDQLLTTVKQLIEGGSETGQEDIPVHGIILGSTPDSLVYLGDPVEQAQVREDLDKVLMSRITDEYEFTAKTEWNSFGYDVLSEIGIPFETKRARIADGYAETLERGSGIQHEFESVPEDFKACLPELAKVVFLDQNYEEAFADYPALRYVWQQVTEGDEYNVFSRKIGFLAELLRRWTGSVADEFDPETIRDEVEAFAAENREALREDLHPHVDVGSIVVERFSKAGLEELSLPDGDEMCFLCGRTASREFKKGREAFYSTQSFSKRVGPEAPYKHICPVCNLEHALLRHTVEDRDFSIDSDIEIAFVYYDEFVANLTVGTGQEPDRLVRTLLGTTEDSDDGTALATPELVASSFAPQYHLQPLYVGDENARLRRVRELLDTLVSQGFKVVIGKPFTEFRPRDALFADLTPTRRQTEFDADRIESYETLEQSLRLFEILRSVAASEDFRNDREFLSISHDDFLSIADLVVRESDWYERVRELTHEHFVNNQHEETYMQMREVAQKGLELYGKEYGSRHQKVKLFRLAIDSLLDGLNRGMDADELREHVAGQVYKTAKEEDYTGLVTTDQAEAFVEALLDYLRESDSLNKEALSRRRNTLSNTYLFAYDRLLEELQEEDTEEPEEAPS